MSTGFTNKKRKILESLNVSPDAYTDASPKGTIDEPIRAFVDEINAIENLVTTSSCSGRFAIYLEGSKKDDTDTANGSSEQQAASTGGKGGGQWIYVTHKALTLVPTVCDMIGSKHGPQIIYTTDPISSNARIIHFKFEPMILHILADSTDAAKRVLAAAQVAGFRESGISSISGPPNRDPDMVMVAVRSTGLSTDSPIGYSRQGIEGMELALSVSEAYIQSLVALANEKFIVNMTRTKHFRQCLLDSFAPSTKAASDWEPADVRKARKREEGLRRQAEARLQKDQSKTTIVRDLSLDEAELDQ